MENPTARETTHATSPAPYPITVASSTSAAWAAKGAMAVAKAATAAAFLLFSTLASTLGVATCLMALVFGEGVEKAEVHAITAAKKRARVWKVFILNVYIYEWMISEFVMVCTTMARGWECSSVEEPDRAKVARCLEPDVCVNPSVLARRYIRLKYTIQF
jgi:hypothetical protein